MAGRKWWQILAGLWFVLYGLLAVTSVTFAAAPIIMGFGAIIVGALIWLDR